MATFVTDTFTATDGTTLQAHVGEVGASWTRDVSGTPDILATSGRMYFPAVSGGQNAKYLASGVPATAEYDVELDIRQLTAVGTAGIWVRAVSNIAAAYYLARFLAATQTWELIRIGGSGGTLSLGTWVDPSFSLGTTKRLRFQVRDATKKLFVDGVERVSSTDNNASLLVKGFVGVRLEGISSLTVGVHVDNFTAYDPLPPPANTVAPAITGTAIVGQTVSCSTGTWSNSPSGYAYQWKRNGLNIGGATSATYLLDNADIAQAVTCTVTATNTTGATSASSNTIVPADLLPPPTNTTAPTVTTLGYATTGHTATCAPGVWSDSPTNYAYQWTRDGSNIAGATGTTHILAVADEGHAIRCAVTATNASGTGTALSNTLNAEANHSVATQTDIVYQGSATGLTGSIYVTVVKLDDATTVSARSAAAVIELAAGSGTYRARRNLDAGRYVALFDEGVFAPASITTVPVAV